MPNSQIKHIFEFSKNGKTQPLLDALNNTDDPHVINERQNSVLALALKNGQWQTAQALIENDFTYFHANQPGLISACQCKKDELQGIQLALQLNQDIDCKNQHKRTAIMTVSLLGHVNKAEELLKHNASTTLKDHQGNTALMDAIHSRNKLMVELILEQSPDVDQTNNQGETALVLELKQKSPVEDIVTQLLNAGSNPELCDGNKKSAWLLAKQKHPKIARLIETHLNNVNQIELPFFTNDYQPQETVEQKNIDPIAPIEINPEITVSEETINNEKIEPSINLDSATQAPLIVNDTLEPSVNINIPSSQDINTEPADKMVLGDSKIEPSIELEPNISTNETESQNNSKPKIEQDEPNVVKPNLSQPYFFTKKVKQSNKQEWFHAAKTGNLGGLNRMIIEGIDINCLDEKGCTALIRACGHSRRAVVSFLLQQDANIEARSSNGSTALSSSIIGNCRRVAGLLLDKGANVNALGPSDYSYVTIAAAQWNDAMLSILYRNGGDIFVINKLKQTLLHIIALAAEYYNNVNNAKTSIQYLLDHGMDINTQDDNGDTALMILCGTHKNKYDVDDRNIASIAHCLIKMGAAAAITNKAGKSAVDACRLHKLQQAKGVLMNALSWND